MKIYRCLAILAGFLIAIPAAAQQRVSIRQNTFAVQGDSVYVDMIIALNGVQPDKNAFVVLTPYLNWKNGATVMDFPVIVINGQNRQRTYNRLGKLHIEPVYVGQVIDASDEYAPQTYRYKAVVPYEAWMSEAEFFLREDQCECNGPLVPIATELIAGRMENRNPARTAPERIVTMNFAASFKVPNPEPVKTRSESGKAYLDFAQGQSAIKPGFGNNASELAKIGEMVMSVKNNPYATITGISIDGWASPEGSAASNQTLSGRRAAALKEYIRTAYGFRDNLFRTTGQGEDWTTLGQLVTESGMAGLEQAQGIIRGGEVPDTKERQLKALAGGSTWQWMLTKLFPQLRRSDYELSYTIIPFTVEKGKEVIKTNPSNLSLNEMFLIAQTYPVGSADYNRIFAVASEQYPQSDIANLNMAANALAQKDSSTATVYLNKVQNRDAAWQNNMGVACAIEGRYDQAHAHFTTAAGNAEAAENLAELEKLNKQ